MLRIHRIWICALLAIAGAQPAEDRAAERDRMVAEQIAGRGIRRPDLLRVLRLTPRHLFLPEEVRELAYRDQPVPISYDATISQPYIVALMTELLDPQRSNKVLEIGTGSGYQAAILAQLTREVYSVEIVPELAQSAARTLRRLRYDNVAVRHGDGYLGWPEHSPFDRIILTAAPPEIPSALIDQLAAGGRLVAPVGAGVEQDLVVLDKDLRGRTTRRKVEPVLFVPMRRGK